MTGVGLCRACYLEPHKLQVGGTMEGSRVHMYGGGGREGGGGTLLAHIDHVYLLGWEL